MASAAAFWDSERGLDVVVIRIETLVETEHRIEHERAHKRSGLKLILLENLRECRVAFWENIVIVVKDSELWGSQSGEHGCVSGKGDRDRGIAVLKYDVFLSELADVWRLNIWSIVRAENVPSCGVHADQNDVGRRKRHRSAARQTARFHVTQTH